MQFGGALAFARTLADGASEVGEEAALEVELGIGELARAHPATGSGNVGDDAGHEVDRIVEHLGGEATGLGAGEIDFVPGVPVVRGDGELIGARFADLGGEGPDVEARPHELRRKVIEELRIGRWIAGTDVVEGFDDAGAEEVTPDAVRVARGEVRIIGRDDPGRELLASCGFVRLGEGDLGEVGLVGEFGRGDRSGAVVLQIALGFISDDLIKRLGTLDGGAADVLVRGVFAVAIEPDLREVGGGLVVLILRPALEGVVVALVAVETCREEEVGRVFDDLGGLAEDLVITRGGILLVRAAGGEDLVGELIVGRVRLDLLADPVAVEASAFVSEELGVHLEHVAPLVRPVIGVFGRLDQFIDEGVALHPGGAVVGEEGLDLVGCRRQTGQVEMDAADEFLVGAKLARLEFHAFPFRGDEIVDLAPALGGFPGEALAVAHHRQGGGGIGAFVAGEDGGLAAADGVEQAELVVLGDLGVAGFKVGLEGDVARLAIGVAGDDAELLATAEILDDGIFREEFDRGDLRGLCVELCPRSDPLADDVVIARVVIGQHACLVGNGTGRLEQHQRIIGRGEIDAAGGVVVGESADVVDGIVAAEAELEAALAILRAVTSAHVAAEARDDGIHILHEVELGRGRGGGILHWSGRVFVAKGRDERAFSHRGGTDDASVRDGRGGAVDAPFHKAGDVGGGAVVEGRGGEDLGVAGRRVEGQIGRRQGDRGDGASFGEAADGLVVFRFFAVGQGRIGLHLGQGRVDRDGGEGLLLGEGLCIEETDFAIGTAGRDGLAIGCKGHRIHRRRHVETLEKLGPSGVELIEDRIDLALGIGGALHRFKKLLQLGSDRRVILRFKKMDLPGRVETGDGGKGLAIGSKGGVPDAPLHRRVFADEIGVVADLADGLAFGAVDLWHPVRSADEDVILRGVAVDRVEAAGEGAGGDRSEVVDEALGRGLGEFRGHVAADGDEVIALHRPIGVEDPVVVAAHEEDLLAVRRLDRPDRVVGQAESDEGAVGRPARAVGGVESDDL